MNALKRKCGVSNIHSLFLVVGSGDMFIGYEFMLDYGRREGGIYKRCRWWNV